MSAGKTTCWVKTAVRSLIVSRDPPDENQAKVSSISRVRPLFLFFNSLYYYPYQRNKLLYKYFTRWIWPSVFNKAQHSPLLSVKCAINRCCTRTCLHAQLQVHSHTQNLLMTPHQSRANCQPAHTLPVSEKSCGSVEVQRGGRHYHTHTNTHHSRLDVFWHTELHQSALTSDNLKQGKV